MEGVIAGLQNKGIIESSVWCGKISSAIAAGLKRWVYSIDISGAS
jgi:hypothetical protein